MKRDKSRETRRDKERNHMYRKQLLQRIGISIITLMTPITMTGCSLRMQAFTEDIQHPEEVIEVLQETIDSYTDDQFKDTYDTQTLADELTADCIENGYELQEAKLVRVVDGDTIIVEIEEEEVRIRLIGINTPESVASQEYLDRTGKENTEEGKDASEWLKSFLNDYPTVYLQKDVSDTDKYDRALRYVWLSVPTDIENIDEVRTKMLNGILIENGLAKVASYEPDTHYADMFTAIETGTTDLYEIDR